MTDKVDDKDSKGTKGAKEHSKAKDEPKKSKNEPVSVNPAPPFKIVTIVMLLAWAGAYLTGSHQRMEDFKLLFKANTWLELPERAMTMYKPVESLTLQQWIKKEERIALKQLRKNIHPKGTMEGVVVASPSTSNPDYWYHWTRDAALVFRPLVQGFENKEKVYTSDILAYIRSTRHMQNKQTVIGGFDSGGLGEVKYYVNYEPFRGEWGRPQNDGPALRVLTLARVAQTLLGSPAEFEREFVKRVLYDSKLPTNSAIKGDLEHIAKHWQQACFDLWEEVSGQHFYTLLTIRTALEQGAKLARRLEDPGAADYYEKVAREITPVLESFWSPEKGIIRVTQNHGVGRDSQENAHTGDNTYGKASELDMAVVLAVLHAGTESEWFGSGRYADQVLSTLQHLRTEFGQVYPINYNKSIQALGRYPEDKYDGYGLSRANPWYLCTLAAAELVYLTAADLLARSTPFRISPEGYGFYSSVSPGIVKVGDELQPGSEQLRNLTKAMGRLGDGFVNFVRYTAMRNGSMHEQFNLVTGRGQGARDLTWSYAAFLSAIDARKLLLKALG